MDKLKGMTEARRAALANANKRAVEAEEAAKSKALLLKKKTEELSKLQTRLELTRQSTTLIKDLLVAYQKLDDAKKKLAVYTEKADSLGKKVDGIHDDADTYESKFQTTKKKYIQLLSELDNLAMN